MLSDCSPEDEDVSNRQAAHSTTSFGAEGNQYQNNVHHFESNCEDSLVKISVALLC